MLIQSCGPFVKDFNVFNGAHGLVVKGVWTVTYIHADRLLVRTSLGQVVTLDVLCCVLRQGSITALFQPPPPTHTHSCNVYPVWWLTAMDWCPTQGKSMTHPMSTTETGDKHQLYAPHGVEKDFNSNVFMNYVLYLLVYLNCMYIYFLVCTSFHN